MVRHLELIVAPFGTFFVFVIWRKRLDHMLLFPKCIRESLFSASSSNWNIFLITDAGKLMTCLPRRLTSEVILVGCAVIPLCRCDRNDKKTHPVYCKCSCGDRDRVRAGGEVCSDDCDTPGHRWKYTDNARNEDHTDATVTDVYGDIDNGFEVDNHSRTIYTLKMDILIDTVSLLSLLDMDHT